MILKNWDYSFQNPRCLQLRTNSPYIGKFKERGRNKPYPLYKRKNKKQKIPDRKGPLTLDFYSKGKAKGKSLKEKIK